MGKRSREKRERRLARAAMPSEILGRESGWDPAASELDAESNRTLGAVTREHAVAMPVIFAVALLVRAAALMLIARSPYREVSNIDSDSYETWANAILTGGWLPSGGFYQSPLYAYYLATVHKLFGPGSFPPRIIQIILGSASAVILYAIGTRLFTRRVGWIAGLALAFYGPLILEEVTISKTTLLVFTVVAAFGLYLLALPSLRLSAIAASGFLLGVSVVGVGQWLPTFFVFSVVAVLAPQGVTRRKRVLAAAVFLAAGMVPIAPVAVWNSVHGGGLLLTSGDAGLNFYEGNNERASGLPAGPPGLRDVPKYEEDDSRKIAERETGRTMRPAEVSAYWSKRGLEFISSHPADSLTLLGKKVRVLFNGYEVPDNYQYTFMRTYFVPIFYGCLSFGVIAPFALVGMAFPIWRRRTVLAMAVLCLAYLATLLLFYVRSRYRIPAVPFLIVFAAVAVERGIVWFRARAWFELGMGCAALLTAALFINHLYCEPPAHGFPAVCLGGDTWYDQEWMKLAEWYDGKGDVDQAIPYMRNATECSAPRSAGQTWYWLATLEEKKIEASAGAKIDAEARQHAEAAEQAYRQCVELRYRPKATFFKLVSLLARMENAEGAEKAIDKALAVNALDRAMLLQIAQAQSQSGHCASAEIVLGRADKDRGFYSDEVRSILSSCQADGKTIR